MDQKAPGCRSAQHSDKAPSPCSPQCPPPSPRARHAAVTGLEPRSTFLGEEDGVSDASSGCSLDIMLEGRVIEVALHPPLSAGPAGPAGTGTCCCYGTLLLPSCSRTRICLCGCRCWYYRVSDSEENLQNKRLGKISR